MSTDSRQADLYDLLSHSVRETQYSFTPAGAAGASVSTGLAAEGQYGMHAATCISMQLNPQPHMAAALLCETGSNPASVMAPPTPCPFAAAGWPSLVRPLSPVLAEMPGMVLERYNACQVRLAVFVGCMGNGMYAVAAACAFAEV